MLFVFSNEALSAQESLRHSDMTQQARAAGYYEHESGVQLLCRSIWLDDGGTTC